MLFLPQSVFELRQQLSAHSEGPFLTRADYQQALEADPFDSVSLFGIGALEQKSGNLEEAAALFRAAIEAHPCASQPYMALSENARLRGDETLSAAVGLLGAAIELAESPRKIEETLELLAPQIEIPDSLSAEERQRLACALMSMQLPEEPESVTLAVLPMRMVRVLLDAEFLDPEKVDAVIAQGPAIAPFLMGLVRDWVQGANPEVPAWTVENALGLLGEVGSAAHLSELYELVTLDDIDVSQPAVWAITRILQRSPADGLVRLRELAPELDAVQYTVTLGILLSIPEEFRPPELITSLTQNIDQFDQQGLDNFLPMIFLSVCALLGRPRGLELSRSLRSRLATRLSRSGRKDCDEALRPLPELPPNPAETQPLRFSVYEICAGEAFWDAEDDDDLPQLPVTAGPRTGRNDPCWCGSGKKYKKCHLDPDSGAPPAVSSPVPDPWSGLRDRIVRFLYSQLEPGEQQRVEREMYGDSEPDPMAVADYLVHDHTLARLKGRLLDAFLQKQGSSLSADEREIITDWSRSAFSLFEVEEIRKGSGARIRDLFWNRSIDIRDISFSRSVLPFAIVMTRVIQGPRGTELTGAVLEVPRAWSDRFRAWLEADREELQLEWRAYFKQNLPRIHRKWHGMPQEYAQSIRLSNTDGDELLFSDARYTIAAGVDAAALLVESKEFREVQQGREFLWLNSTETILGHIDLEPGSLMLQCNSRKRLDRGKKLLRKVLGKAILHTGDEFREASRLPARDTPADPAPQRMDTPEMQAAIRSFLDQHYRTWPDIKLPALNGKTPRQAAKTAKGRQDLERILRDMENGEARNTRLGQPACDFSSLRRELGMDQ